MASTDGPVRRWRRRAGRVVRGVRRGALSATSGRSTSSPTSPASPARPHDRIGSGLALVAEAERSAGELPQVSGPRTYWARRRVVRLPDLAPEVHGLVPPSHRDGWEPGADGLREVEAPIAADVVALAKFDIGTEPKLRAAYADSQLTLSVQPVSTSGADGIARAVAAYRTVVPHAPHLVPRLVGQGRLSGGVPYLVEGWLHGEPLVHGRALAAAAGEILSGLAAVHRGHGLTAGGLNTQWVRVGERWEELR
ncbi:hypothetical protein [Ornithinimicrobium sp. Y1694]|uniref:hypothetical protein n=1 Tax=Ornithinimicrobium sp. Y1694 TaxID=3418590 RepID=UPI003CEF0E7A